MQEDIKKIIHDGVYAPSGENCQPWKFSVKGHAIEIYNIPEADQSLYNFKQRGSYIAHGALIETMAISASKFGYKLSATIFPDKDNLDHIATVTLEKNPQIIIDPLFNVIKERHTNRKDHKPEKLSPEHKNKLIESVHLTNLAEMKIVDDEQSMKTLGKAMAINELVIFENKDLHKFFFDHIIWNEQDQNKAGGFYIKTLEFLPHQLKAVKIIKNWTVLTILNKILGISKMITKENAEKYAKSGALGVIITKGDNDSDFVNAGRAVQRVWLTATQLGISVQPCTGVLYFEQRIKQGDSNVFSSAHKTEIENAYKNVEHVFGAEGKTIPMLFRLGFSEPASARSMRKEPEIIWE